MCCQSEGGGGWDGWMEEHVYEGFLVGNVTRRRGGGGGREGKQDSNSVEQDL